MYATDFELLTPDGSLTYDEYTGFLERILGEEGVRVLNPSLISQLP